MGVTDSEPSQAVLVQDGHVLVSGGHRVGVGQAPRKGSFYHNSSPNTALDPEGRKSSQDHNQSVSKIVLKLF